MYDVESPATVEDDDMDVEEEEEEELARMGEEEEDCAGEEIVGTKDGDGETCFRFLVVDSTVLSLTAASSVFTER